MNSTTPVTSAAQHDTDFRTAVIGLREAHTKFKSGELKSVPHSDMRQQHLGAALQALAGLYGVMLRGPHYIDSNGEYSLAALKDAGSNPSVQGCAPFGEFAAVLNPHSPRTGIMPCALTSDSGWCRINHFSVENMVMEQAAARGI